MSLRRSILIKMTPEVSITDLKALDLIMIMIFELRSVNIAQNKS